MHSLKRCLLISVIYYMPSFPLKHTKAVFTSPKLQFISECRYAQSMIYCRCVVSNNNEEKFWSLHSILQLKLFYASFAASVCPFCDIHGKCIVCNAHALSRKAKIYDEYCHLNVIKCKGICVCICK